MREMQDLGGCVSKEWGPVYLLASRYSMGGRLAILVESIQDGPVGNLTTNLPEADLGPDEFLVRDDGAEGAFTAHILSLFPGYWEPTGRRVPSGWITMPVYKLGPEFPELRI